MIIKNPLIVSAGGGDTTTVKNLLDTIQKCSNLFAGYQGTSIDGLIAYDDTSNVTDMNGLVYNCSSLTTIPLLNTSNVTNMNSMFQGCTKLTSIPLLNTSKVTMMSLMFYKCSSLTTIPLLNTSNVTEMSNMFSGCAKLTTVPELDVSKVTAFRNIFYNCSNLKSILMTGMKKSFDISASEKFERTDLVTILNNLATVQTTETLTMGATNLAKLTDEDKAIATNKGWTLA